MYSYKGILEALEALVENTHNRPERREITLDYKDLEVTAITKVHSGSYYEPPYADYGNTTVDYEYETDNYEIGETIWDEMTAEEFNELEKICNSKDDDVLFDYLIEHAEEYLEDPKWKDRIYKHLEDSVRSHWEYLDDAEGGSWGD